MSTFSTFEKYYLSPMFIYWGFFHNVLELPRLLNIQYLFRLNKKEYIFLLTLLSFFFKCFFLAEKICFKLHYSNLYFNFNIIKNKNTFFYFFYFIKFFAFFNIYDIKINFKIFLNKFNKSIFMISTKKLIFFISDICDAISNKSWYNILLYKIYVLFQYIFYSSHGLSLNFFIFIKFYINIKYHRYFFKILNIYNIY